MQTSDELFTLFTEAARVSFVAETIRKRNDPPQTLLGSRVGGEPYLENEDEWPRSREVPLDFIFQLDFSNIASQLSFKIPFRLLSFFAHQGRLPSQDTDFVIVTYSNPSQQKSVPISTELYRDWPKGEELVWYEMEEFKRGIRLPDFEDLQALRGDSLAFARQNEEGREKLHMQFQEQEKVTTFLGGFPRWMNGYHRVCCSSCGNLMYQLCQLDQLAFDAQHLGVGVCGFFHLFFCPDHPSEFAVRMSPLS